MTLRNLNHDRCLVIKQHARKRVTFVHVLVNTVLLKGVWLYQLDNGTLVTICGRFFGVFFCFLVFWFFLREFVAIPSPATQQESSSRPGEDEEIRHTQEKASVGRQVLALLSFLKPFFWRNGRKIYKIPSKNNPSVVHFQIDCDYCLDGKRNNRNSTG